MKTHINLLPHPFRRRLLVKTRLLQWSVVWGLILVIAFGVSYWRFLGLNIKQRTVASQDRHAAPLRHMQAENADIRTQLAAHGARQALLAELESAQHPLRVVGLISRSTRIGGARLQVQSFNLVQGQESSVEDLEVGDAESSNHLTLVGTAIDDLAITQFVHALRNGTPFKNVELKSSTRTRAATTEIREYLIECSF